MFIEAILFLALLSLCFGWQRQTRVVAPPAAAAALKTRALMQAPKVNGVQPLNGKKSQSRHKRRNSIDATPPRRNVSNVVTPVRSLDDLSVGRSSGDDSFSCDCS